MAKNGKSGSVEGADPHRPRRMSVAPPYPVRYRARRTKAATQDAPMRALAPVMLRESVAEAVERLIPRKSRSLLVEEFLVEYMRTYWPDDKAVQALSKDQPAVVVVQEGERG